MTDARDERLAALHAAATAGEAFASHPDSEAIAAAAQHRGRESERLRTLDHVSRCAQCRWEFELLRSAHVASRQLVANAWQRRGTALAAAAVLIAAVSLSLGRAFPRRSAEIPGERGGAPAGSERVIVLVEPARRSPAVNSPVLEWRAVPGAASYRVEVLDSAGAVVARRETRDTMITVPGLAPGRDYHWWVRANAGGQEWRSAFEAFSTRP